MLLLTFQVTVLLWSFSCFSPLFSWIETVRVIFSLMSLQRLPTHVSPPHRSMQSMPAFCCSQDHLFWLFKLLICVGAVGLQELRGMDCTLWHHTGSPHWCYFI
ncbi:hypothetical protein FKM82_012545 [Ascaphus truei]